MVFLQAKDGKGLAASPATPGTAPGSPASCKRQRACPEHGLAKG